MHTYILLGNCDLMSGFIKHSLCFADVISRWAALLVSMPRQQLVACFYLGFSAFV